MADRQLPTCAHLAAAPALLEAYFGPLCPVLPRPTIASFLYIEEFSGIRLRAEPCTVERDWYLLTSADLNPANNDDLKISLMDLLTAAAAAGNEQERRWTTSRLISRPIPFLSFVFSFIIFAVVDSGGGGSSVDELWFIGWLVRRQRLFREKYPPSSFLVPRICGGLPPQPSILISLTCPTALSIHDFPSVHQGMRGNEVV
ncbi:hypothetical protein Ddc_01957 [Ditylenchus destructor]|nr:hypothetical protein Ddc_01957 [Ditylenchus destructor]